MVCSICNSSIMIPFAYATYCRPPFRYEELCTMLLLPTAYLHCCSPWVPDRFTPACMLACVALACKPARTLKYLYIKRYISQTCTCVQR